MQDSKDYIYEKVLMQLEKQRIFLDVDLTLAKFSKVVGTNTTYLSNIINQRFGCNFKTLLNRYRIGYATEKMKEEGTGMVGNTERFGFKSKSTFYDSFVKVTGTNPTSYLKADNK